MKDKNWLVFQWVKESVIHWQTSLICHPLEAILYWFRITHGWGVCLKIFWLCEVVLKIILISIYFYVGWPAPSRTSNRLFKIGIQSHHFKISCCLNWRRKTNMMCSKISYIYIHIYILTDTVWWHLYWMCCVGEKYTLCSAYIFQTELLWILKINGALFVTQYAFCWKPWVINFKNVTENSHFL